MRRAMRRRDVDENVVAAPLHLHYDASVGRITGKKGAKRDCILNVLDKSHDFQE